MAVYTTIDNPEAYFQTKLYTGNGSTQTITLDNTDADLDPDLIWVKKRSGSHDSVVVDTVRGVTKVIETSTTDAEATWTNGITAISTDSFALGDAGANNDNTETFVAWCWKAGTSFSNDASATSIGDIDSTGSASTTAGFSIVSWTGTGSNGGIKHGLNTKPSMIITKPRSDVGSWYTYHGKIASDPETDFFKLNENEASADNATVWNDTAPTTSIFTTGTAFDSGRTFIGYCFSDIQGYCKTGTYKGNGSTSGPFIYCGFRPAFIILKFIGGAYNWMIYDAKREGYNVDNDHLKANNSDAEGTSDDLDILSNGFKMRTSGVGENSSGEPYLWIAFAEAPFVNSNGVPANAR